MLTLPATFRHWLRSAVYALPLDGSRRRLKRLVKTPDVHETSDFWNGELAGRMAAPNRNGRMSNALRDATTVQLLRVCGPTPHRVLDLGCGYCDLAHALDEQGLEHYTGVDLSDFVIDRAGREASSWPVTARCELDFHHEDLRHFIPHDDARYDAIVFNEVLKYVEIDEAAAQLDRYSRWLAPAGVLCVNLTDDPKCRAIFRRLARRFTWVYGLLYQQAPHRPQFQVATDLATPAYYAGLFRPRRSSA